MPTPALNALLFASPYSAEARAAFAAMSTPPSVPLKRLYDACIRSLLLAGIWTKLDALYLMNAETAQAARVNLKNPGTYDLTATSSPTFTAKVGYAGDGAAAYLNTNFNPSTVTAPNFVQDSASAFVWGLTQGASNLPTLGQAGTTNTEIYPRKADNFAYGRASCASLTTTAANGDGRGFFHINRSAAGASQLYKNGSSIATDTAASAAPSAATLALFRTGASFAAVSAAMAGMGSSLSAQNAADLYSALNTFKTGVDALP